jgi:penicillin-binding protein 2
MLVFDQLKKNDTHLAMLAAAISAGLCALLAGLWWVQIVNVREFRSSLETQTFRTVRMPAVRGKILDRNGQVLADSRATYNISLFLEDLSPAFQKEYKVIRPRITVTNSLPFWKRWLGADEVKTTYRKLTEEETSALQWEARYRVVSNAIRRLSFQLATPLEFDREKFKKHYTVSRAMPFTVLKGANRTQIARFEESATGNVAADLEMQTTRIYPFNTTASHLLGYVVRRNDSVANEQAFYTYRLPDFTGLVGIEGGYDLQLRGAAGEKTVVVNNLGYRQSETVLTPAEAGRNVVLTIDLAIQKEAEAAMRRRIGMNARSAVVVMDVHTGDILALASSPAYDPNNFITNFTPAEFVRWKDKSLGVQKNRATFENYQAGSIFKTIVALAALENGLNPDEIVIVQENRRTGKGIYYVGNQPFRDTAPPGPYDLRRALARSSNTYFITNGLRRGVFDRIVELGQHLHLGERIGLKLNQETSGHFPSPGMARKWSAGDKANVCIGQGYLDVTPVQMAVMTAALANGGNVIQPRIVDRLESQDPTGLEPAEVFPKSVVRDHLGVQQRNIQIVHDAMLAETEDPQYGTGHNARVPGLRICGKTGTAEREERDANGNMVKRNTTWFISFAPYENPKYAVVVMAEDGQSGGQTCAPVAADVYTALIKPPSQPNGAVARTN